MKQQALNPNLHSPQRRLIELRMEHADLDDLIDRLAIDQPSYSAYLAATKE